MCRWVAGPEVRCELWVDGGVQSSLDAVAEGEEVCFGREPGEARYLGWVEPIHIFERGVSIPCPCAEVSQSRTVYQQVCAGL